MPQNSTRDQTEAYLNLKPLKSLKDNFQIDIASCLQEYLKELHGADASVSQLEAIDGVDIAELKTNFISAAMLLQNSSTVYSRKVEYLHSLVYESLEALQKASNPSDKKGLSRRQSGKYKNADPDIEEFEAFDPDWNFLVFEEDTIPVDEDGHGIDLPISDRNLNSRNNTPNTNNINNTCARISLGGGMSITRLDQTLNTVTQNKTAIQSHAAQQLIRNFLDGNHATAAMASHAGGSYDPSQAALRLVSGVCDIHESGALLLPGTGNDEQCDIEGPHSNGMMGANLRLGVENAERLDMTMEDNEDNNITGEGNENAFNIDFHGNAYDDCDDEGDGFVIHSPQLNENENAFDQRGILRSARADFNIDDTEVDMIQPRSEKDKHISKPKYSSPWDMLDPHDDREAKSRPIRSAVTYRLPIDCEDPPSASVTGAMTKTEKWKIKRAKSRLTSQKKNIENANTKNYTSMAVQEYRNMFLNIQKNRRQSSIACDEDDVIMDSSTECNHDMRTMTPLPTKGLLFGDEFLYIANAQAKCKAAEKRRLERKQSEARNESRSAIIANERFTDMYDDNDDDYDGPAFDFGGDDDNSLTNVHGPNCDQTDEAIDAFGGVFGNETDTSDNGNGGGCQRTFEELCRAHLKEFAKGAERFAVETQVSRKVSTWQSKLELILAQEDERPEFDISKYGSKLIAQAKDSSKLDSYTSPASNLFVSITKTQEPFEVCRTFLASLMLCNSENIIFTDVESNSVSSPADLRLRILKNNTELPTETYLAPSIANALARSELMAD